MLLAGRAGADPTRSTLGFAAVARVRRRPSGRRDRRAARARSPRSPTSPRRPASPSAACTCAARSTRADRAAVFGGAVAFVAPVAARPRFPWRVRRRARARRAGRSRRSSPVHAEVIVDGGMLVEASDADALADGAEPQALGVHRRGRPARRARRRPRTRVLVARGGGQGVAAPRRAVDAATLAARTPNRRVERRFAKSLVFICNFRHTVHMTGARQRGASRASADRRVGRWRPCSSIGGVSAAGRRPVPRERSQPASLRHPARRRRSIVKTADLSKFQAGQHHQRRGVLQLAATMTRGADPVVPAVEGAHAASPGTPASRTGTTRRARRPPTRCAARTRAASASARRAIIYKVAQACGINPQVLLVMLQKEQGLVTHTWPSDWRYTIAMGQGCPDTAACDTRYYGFFNQVYGAAWQLKRYANPPGTSQYFTWYAPGQDVERPLPPERGVRQRRRCTSRTRRRRTSTTTRRTSRTPPRSRAGYGEGDGCSAYGNRNFYQYFTDWFGSTQADPLQVLQVSGTSERYLVSQGGRWRLTTTELAAQFTWISAVRDVSRAGPGRLPGSWHRRSCDPHHERCGLPARQRTAIPRA